MLRNNLRVSSPFNVLWTTLVVLLSLNACSQSLDVLRPISDNIRRQCTDDDADAVSITYLGVSGYLIRRGETALLTAPFYSNQSIPRMIFRQRIEPNKTLVDQFLPDVSDVEAILVPHSHYDHLLDVPYIATRHAPQANIYGSQTMAHMLAAIPELSTRVHSLKTLSGSPTQSGTWTYTRNQRVRFMALNWEHAPHFLGIKFLQGSINEDLTKLPRSMFDWVEGQTLAFVIDFLDPKGQTDLRLFYHGSASNSPAFDQLPSLDLGAPPETALLLCVASFSQVDRYPEGLIENTQPKWVLLNHYEDFFRPQTKPLRGVPGTNLKKFVTRLTAAMPENSEWLTPLPGTTVNICRGKPHPN